jgi:hypothetical protein
MSSREIARSRRASPQSMLSRCSPSLLVPRNEPTWTTARLTWPVGAKRHAHRHRDASVLLGQTRRRAPRGGRDSVRERRALPHRAQHVARAPWHSDPSSSDPRPGRMGHTGAGVRETREAVDHRPNREPRRSLGSMAATPSVSLPRLGPADAKPNTLVRECRSAEKRREEDIAPSCRGTPLAQRQGPFTSRR